MFRDLPWPWQMTAVTVVAVVSVIVVILILDAVGKDGRP
jgi:negative regulator of sigma E activity